MTTLRELKEDIGEIKVDVKEIKDFMLQSVQRVSKIEAGHAAMWWVLALGGTIITALVGYLRFQ